MTTKARAYPAVVRHANDTYHITLCGELGVQPQVLQHGTLDYVATMDYLSEDVGYAVHMHPGLWVCSADGGLISRRQGVPARPLSGITMPSQSAE